MLLFYVLNEGIFHINKASESRFYNFDEEPTVNPNLAYQFCTITHPLNTTLANFFRNESGYFHYDANTLYTKNPYQLISLERFAALHNLALRVETFERLNDLELKAVSGSE